MLAQFKVSFFYWVLTWNLCFSSGKSISYLVIHEFFLMVHSAPNNSQERTNVPIKLTRGIYFQVLDLGYLNLISIPYARAPNMIPCINATKAQ